MGDNERDIEVTIEALREKLSAPDRAGALDLLGTKIAEEEEGRARRLTPLLKVRATIEREALDYERATQTLSEVTRLAPDDVWAFIDLGDLYEITGSLDEAAKAFRNAAEAAQRQGDERGLSVAFIKIGDVQMAQGNLAGALKSYYDSLAIAERLSKSDPGNAVWQRDLRPWQCRLAGDLSVSYNFVGNVQMAQGDLDGALKSYRESLATAERLAKSDPSNAFWQRDLSVAGEVQAEQGDLAGALKSYREGLAIVERLAKSDPGNAE